ncbi:MAG: InlB B-repeat-containing protein, partial [Clostridia bacterium]|nr:InlB B-repeat-containing protein [Clostridia bacterium]
MNSKTSRAKYLKFAILIISVCFILGAISACLPFNVSIPTLDNNAVTPTARPIETHTGDLSSFGNGAKYVFTDGTKVSGYRTGTEQFDITTIIVDATDTLGTQNNPYVITTTDEWDIFVQKMEIDTTRGNGQYFVLGADLDFAGKTFHSVRYFKGTFYGLGYTLKNIDITSWTYVNSAGAETAIGTNDTYGFSVFCQTTGAIITDLIVENFKCVGPTQTAVVYNNRTTFIGAIIGYSNGSDEVYNCHVTATYNIANITYSRYVTVGGIVGAHYSTVNTTPLTVYRCSGEIEITSKHTSSSTFGGAILGEVYATQLYLYDCVGKAKINLISGVYMGSGPLVGFIEQTTKTVLENTVATFDANSTLKPVGGAICSVTIGNRSLEFRNLYGEGVIGADGSTKSSLHSITGTLALTTSNCTASNINIAKTCSSYATPYDGADRLTGLGIAGLPNEVSSLDLLISLATSNVRSTDAGTMSSRIWDVEKTNKLATYLDRDYDGGETIINYSPVRNYLVATITFKNLLSEDKEQDIVSVPIDDYMVGDVLPSASNNTEFASYIASKTNHIFLGWTDDPTGESEPFKELPSGYFGDVTLYAVWGLPDSYVNSNIKTSLSVDKNLIEYDSVASITLTAKVEHTAPSSGAMTNPKPMYYFMQDGEEKTTSANVKNSGVLSVKTVKDSGKYTFKYRLTDGLEPLWFYDGDCASSEEKTITIEKGKLEHMTLKDFKISSSTVPYFGKKLEDITFTVSMFNNASKEVELSEVKWQSTIGKVDTKGTNTKKIVLCPVDTDNYETQYVFDATFESQSLVIVFNLAQISQKIEVEVEYGQNYGANEIIYLFEQAYLKALSTWDAEIVGDVSSMAPYLDGKALADGDANADKFDTEYNGINEIHTIQVTFQDASYEVVFNPNNGGGSSPTQETYGYGQFLKKPNDPVNGDLLFVGWYFDEDYIDDNGNEATRNRAWRFNSVGDIPQDRVTKAVTLIAKWLKADTLDS